MKEIWEKIGTAIRHNTGLTVGIILCFMVLLYAYGCESQVSSIRNPVIKINRAELKLEVESEVAKIEQALSELQAMAEVKGRQLDKQDEMKAALFQISLVVAEGGTVNPIGIATTLIAILGIGAVADNRKKDGLIVGKNMTG